MATSATTTVAEREPHQPAPDARRRRPATPAARSPLTSRATAICSAEPGTIRMMYAETSTASDP